MKKIVALSILVILSLNVICQSTESNKDLNFYQKTYEKAKRQKRTGTVLTIAGVTCGALGYIMVGNFNYVSGNVSADATSALGSILFLSGGVMTNVGIPLWISGAIKARNNEKIIKVRYSLRASIDPNGFGVGLNYKF